MIRLEQNVDVKIVKKEGFTAKYLTKEQIAQELTSTDSTHVISAVGTTISKENTGITLTPDVSEKAGAEDSFDAGKTFSAKWYMPKETTDMKYKGLPRWYAGQKLSYFARNQETGKKFMERCGYAVLKFANSLVAGAAITANAFAIF